jgi:hypothetical protein
MLLISTTQASVIVPRSNQCPNQDSIRKLWRAAVCALDRIAVGTLVVALIGHLDTEKQASSRLDYTNDLQALQSRLPQHLDAIMQMIGGSITAGHVILAAQLDLTAYFDNRALLAAIKNGVHLLNRTIPSHRARERERERDWY